MTKTQWVMQLLIFLADPSRWPIHQRHGIRFVKSPGFSTFSTLSQREIELCQSMEESTPMWEAMPRMQAGLWLISMNQKMWNWWSIYRFLKDFFTSLIELSWSWTIFWFSASFFVSWVVFAVVWFLIALVHGDLDMEYLENNPDHVVCVDNVVDFTTAFLFSLETQHTIG